MPLRKPTLLDRIFRRRSRHVSAPLPSLTSALARRAEIFGPAEVRP